MSHAIEIENLAVNFGSTLAVGGVSLSVDYGEVSVLLGPNGAGKTTTTETLLGFRSPSSGRVRIQGLDPVTNHKDVMRGVGALLQKGGVWAPMSPREVLALTSSYYPTPRDYRELIDLLNLSSCATTPWRRLSGGEQQRTLLALALVGRPRVLILDEPTGAVDPEGHRVVRDILRSERARGCAILVTTHQLADAEEIADRVVIMRAGHVVANGTLDELRGDKVVLFESRADLDITRLSELLGATVVSESPGHFRVAVASLDAGLLQTSLASLDAQLEGLRTRASLEERYLELVQADREGSDS